VIYLVPNVPDKLTRKGRESGWQHVPLDREARKELAKRVESLKGRDISAVLGSDLDSGAARIIGDTLHLPVHIDYSLRRFNVGRHHAADRAHVDDILRIMIERWKEHPEHNVKGGDSWLSFSKRFIKRFQQLLDGPDVALLVDERTLHIAQKQEASQLIANGLKLDRIYTVKKAS
jgi:broad specificity phosphatase PhoE